MWIGSWETGPSRSDSRDGRADIASEIGLGTRAGDLGLEGFRLVVLGSIAAGRVGGRHDGGQMKVRGRRSRGELVAKCDEAVGLSESVVDGRV